MKKPLLVLSNSLLRAAYEWRGDPPNLLRAWSQILCRFLIDNPACDPAVRRNVDEIEIIIARRSVTPSP